MTEATRKTNWNELSYEDRVRINGPTTQIYSIANLPSPADPGWSRRKRISDGIVLRMINIHGPFLVSGKKESERCEDGWLGVENSGLALAVESEYVKPSSSSSEMEETVRPFGYVEVT